MAGGIITNSSAISIPFTTNDGPIALPRVVIPTILQIGRDTLGQFKNMTCMFDRYWTVDQTMTTFPICFFYVKKITEVMSTTLNTKRVMLYENQLSADESLTAEQAADSLRPGVMNVLVDNTIKAPRSYNLEIILPFNPVSSQMIRSFDEVNQIMLGMTQAIGISSIAITELNRMMTMVLKTVQNLAGAGAIGTLIPGVDSMAMANKNSLEAMWRAARPMTMKMWTGYHYKYVTITSLNIDKQPNEDDVFRATMGVQERPVLTLTNVRTDVVNPAPPSAVLKYASKVQKAMVMPFTEALGVRKASGAALIGDAPTFGSINPDIPPAFDGPFNLDEFLDKVHPGGSRGAVELTEIERLLRDRNR